MMTMAQTLSIFIVCKTTLGRVSSETYVAKRKLLHHDTGTMYKCYYPDLSTGMVSLKKNNKNCKTVLAVHVTFQFQATFTFSYVKRLHAVLLLQTL